MVVLRMSSSIGTTFAAEAVRQPSTARVVGVSFVVLLHAALVYALITGLAYRVVRVLPVPIVAKIIAQQSPTQTTPPPPTASFKPPPTPFIPPPEVQIAKPPPTPASTAITNVTAVRPPTPAPAPQVVRNLPHVDLASSEAPDYPADSRRLGEEGSVTLQVLVDPSGRATDIKLVQSSGYPRLDQAAIKGIKEGYYRFVPGTIDGKPQPMWLTFTYHWKLQQ